MFNQLKYEKKDVEKCYSISYYEQIIVYHFYK